MVTGQKHRNRFEKQKTIIAGMIRAGDRQGALGNRHHQAQVKDAPILGHVASPLPTIRLIRVGDVASRYPVVGAARGAVAFSRTGEPATGDFADPVVIRTFGEVPSMEELLSAG